MQLDTPLFLARQICLGPIDHDRDAEIEALWRQDAGFLRMIDLKPAIPRMVSQIKKEYEAIEKRMEEKRDLFYFTIRLRADDRLLGFAEITRIDWSNGNGILKLGIGSPDDRQRGYGTEALALLLRYAFAELNLNRLSAVIPEYNLAGMRLFTKLGFVEEVRRRLAVHRGLQRWDLIHMGLLSEEWKGIKSPSSATIGAGH